MTDNHIRPTTHAYLYGYDFTVPDAVVDGDNTQGYLQIVVDDNGEVYVRGSRTLLQQYITLLQENGLPITIDDVRWCG
jgi:hypothetical protein